MSTHKQNIGRSYLKTHWHGIYYIFVALNLFAVSVTLYMNHYNIFEYTKVVQTNSTVATRLKSIGELLVLAQRSNAPGNDIFDSLDFVKEKARYEEESAAFDRHFVELQESVLSEDVSVEEKSELKDRLIDIQNAMTRMREVAKNIFSNFQRNEIKKASSLMAGMDRHYGALLLSIEGLRNTKILAQAKLLERHQGALESAQKVEHFYSISILLAMFGVALFGSRISRQLKQANEQISHIFNNSLDLICIVNLEGKFEAVSPSFTRILGYDQSELLSRAVFDFIHPQDHTATSGAIAQLSQGETLTHFENRYQCKSGEYKLISWVCNADLKHGLLYAIGRDVTDQKNLEYRNNQVLKAIDQSSIVAFTDVKGKITEANDNFCKISGYSRDELIGKDHRIVNSGQHPKSFFAKMWSDIQAGQIWSADIENRTKSGELYSVRSVISPIKNIQGEVEEFLAIRYDLTAQRRSEAALKSALDFNYAILRSAKFSIISTNEDGIITGFNKEAERILGYSADDMLNKQTPAIFHDPEEVANVAAQLSKEYNTEVPVGFDTFVFKARLGHGQFDERQWTYVRKDGNRTQVRLSITALFDNKGKLYGFLGVAKDLTEDLALQQELELEKLKTLRNAKLASLGELSAGVTHEINNPLAIISASLELISKNADNPAQIKSKVEMLKKSSSRIQKIVTGLKKFSRTNERPSLQSQELSNLVKETLVFTEAKSKQHSTPVSIECKSDSHVLCDEIEIQQVVVNLVNNAIDAAKNTPDKWVKIELFDDAETVVLRVIDSGPGLPEHIRNRLYEPFFTTKQVGEGTGLGLSITKGILDAHKAQINLITDCANTCFEVRFPLSKGPKTAES
jgi:PAS domain S-box-containing protein